MINSRRRLRAVRQGIRETVTAVGPWGERALPGWRTHLVRGLTIFIFHEVTDEPSEFHRIAHTSTTPALFAEHIDWILDRFTVIEPPALPQLGGGRSLPANAALITFDDSWAGTFRTALPVLRHRSVPALCCLNMGTVAGDPDLAAALRYTRREVSKPLDSDGGDALIDSVRRELGGDESFVRYQGETATPCDLASAAESGGVWFASHLYHHWDIRMTEDDLLSSSLALNERALVEFPNHLPVFATPHGYVGENGRDIESMARANGIQLILTGTGNQNRDARGPVLDRLFLPVDDSRSAVWWYTAHRRRVLGSRAS